MTDRHHGARSESSRRSHEPTRVRVLFLIESPSGIVHLATPTDNSVRAPAFCGRLPRQDWTRTWEAQAALPVNLIGVCSACARRANGPASTPPVTM